MIPNVPPERKLLGNIAKTVHCDIATIQNILSDFRSHFYTKQYSSPSGKKRVIYCPDKMLLKVQKRISKYILSGVTLPNSMHGYRKKHSIVTNARCHVGKEYVAKFDIQDFFPSIHFSRIAKIFETLGFNRQEADVLTRLVTVDYSLPHGFATSPKLASICLINVEKRIKSIVSKFPIAFSFYSDDITFSGNYDLKSFKNIVVKVFKQEGFKINLGKIKFLGWSDCHEITGVIANQKLNISRPEREKIQAITHNCLIYGPESQMAKYYAEFGNPKRHPINLKRFKDSLKGRLSYIKPINFQLFKVLKSNFDRIEW